MGQVLNLPRPCILHHMKTIALLLSCLLAIPVFAGTDTNPATYFPGGVVMTNTLRSSGISLRACSCTCSAVTLAISPA